jgi:hypothetical protein
MSTTPTANAIAHFMTQRVSAEQTLSYDAMALEIANRFGASSIAISRTGRIAIRPDVLHTFYEHTKSFVVWSRGEQAWRLRGSDDAPRRQVD